jgi:hypothetical protein
MIYLHHIDIIIFLPHHQKVGLVQPPKPAQVSPDQKKIVKARSGTLTALNRGNRFLQGFENKNNGHWQGGIFKETGYPLCSSLHHIS